LLVIIYILCSVVFVGSVLAFGFVAAMPSSSQKPIVDKVTKSLKLKSSSPAEIISALETGKTVRVIVILNVDPKLATKLKNDLSRSSTRATSTTQINQLITPVANTIGVSSEPSFTPFSTVAAFGARLSASQISKLLDDPRVKSIEYDTACDGDNDANGNPENSTEATVKSDETGNYSDGYGGLFHGDESSDGWSDGGKGGNVGSGGSGK